jgi:hypothetical protein
MSSKTKPTTTRKSLFDILFGRSLKGPICKRCHGHGYFRQDKPISHAMRAKAPGENPNNRQAALWQVPAEPFNMSCDKKLPSC